MPKGEVKYPSNLYFILRTKLQKKEIMNTARSNNDCNDRQMNSEKLLLTVNYESEVG